MTPATCLLKVTLLTNLSPLFAADNARADDGNERGKSKQCNTSDRQYRLCACGNEYKHMQISCEKRKTKCLRQRLTAVKNEARREKHDANSKQGKLET